MKWKDVEGKVLVRVEYEDSVSVQFTEQYIVLRDAGE